MFSVMEMERKPHEICKDYGEFALPLTTSYLEPR
jgi:hypothetical protein